MPPVYWNSLSDMFISLSTAFVFGGLIGFERQYRQRTAGLQTNVLVAVGASIFVFMAGHLYGHEGAIRVGAYVVSGIGFLGAGIIMREAGSVVGLNTAATLWCSSAIGTCTGGGLIAEAFMATLCVLTANTMLHPLAEYLGKRPIALSDLEGVCAVNVITPRAGGRAALVLLRSELAQRKYNLRRLEVNPFNGDAVQIRAVIDTAYVDMEGLDSLVDRLNDDSIVSQAYWSRGATV